MGKVTFKELPKNHPIFKSGWLISTVKNQSQKIKSYEKDKAVKKLDNYSCIATYVVLIGGK